MASECLDICQLLHFFCFMISFYLSLVKFVFNGAYSIFSRSKHRLKTVQNLLMKLLRLPGTRDVIVHLILSSSPVVF
jgi:hypothetical protein